MADKGNARAHLRADAVALRGLVELGLDRRQLPLHGVRLHQRRDEELREHVQRLLQVLRADLERVARDLVVRRAIAEPAVRAQERLELVLVRVLVTPCGSELRFRITRQSASTASFNSSVNMQRPASHAPMNSMCSR
jgi:hypothetical protein